ncbi:FMN-linked oxidoreductase [Athelia psychrophila]|uniref:FMN-linked oxidoreductase n=1 Tax=Athelia psychrophila TaxID=1759441 RepID=A0A166AF40_9AGAM|nr:FMN-linked oxidoreductase [Fibularhizoctonia sp. CBS 109695]
MSSVSQKLFEPIQVDDITLGHRVVMAPLTRMRATETHVPGPHAAQYYCQRSVAPGNLLIAEVTFIGEKASGYPCVPSIHSDEQIAGWKKLTLDRIDCGRRTRQWVLHLSAAMGAGLPGRSKLKRDNASSEHTAASAIPVVYLFTGEMQVPRALTAEEIEEFISLYVTAVSNAVHKAGFDGVEIHGASGYLVDQFLQDVSNTRTDNYGGSVENRSRFALEVIKAIVAAVGEKKTALRLSPWSTAQGMGMSNPVPQFTHLVSAIRDLCPDFAYLHVIEPRVNNYDDVETIPAHKYTECDALYALWAPKPLISAGGYDQELGLDVAQKTGQLLFVPSLIENSHTYI